MKDPIHFERHAETAEFFSPLTGMEFAEDRIDVRTDPLTGMTAVASAGLEAKEEMFLGKTDWEYAEALAARTREGCFFCTEKVLEATPRYPDELVPGGRLEHGRALVFPNLFPLAAVHAVVTFPAKHYLRPSEFTPELLAEALGAAFDFAGRAERFYPRLTHLQVSCNHMLPAGASLAHPHLQVFGGETVPWQVELYWRRSAEWKAAHGAGYWETLVDQERESGERYVQGEEGVHWLVPFAPAGAREAIAVVPGAERTAELGAAQTRVLSAGLSKVLAWYEEEGLSAFNFTLFGGALDGRETGFPVVLRVIARTAFKQDYRTDDYFLQKQLGGELMFAAPEEMAARLRTLFAV
jgi:UDPglucose--hexose-1-phosphate uridylyltransferase